MEEGIEEAKRRCRVVEEKVEKHLNFLNSSCKKTLLGLLHSELSFLSRFSSSSSTTTFPSRFTPQAVVHILQQPLISGVSRVCKSIPLSVPNGSTDTRNLKGVHVDIVSTLNGDPVWFIVSDRNPKYICWNGNGSCRNKGLKMRIEHLLCAASSSITLKPSSIILFFSNGLENSVIEKLCDEFKALDFKSNFSCFDCGFLEEVEGEWVNILGRSYQKASVLEIKVDHPESAISSRSNVGIKETLAGEPRADLLGEDIVQNFDSFRSFVSQLKLPLLYFEGARFALAEDSSSNFDLINFDTTALIAIISGIRNGSTEKLMATPENELRSRFKSNFEFVIAQVKAEVQHPIHLALHDVVSGKGGIICETVFAEFKELVSMCGGPNEKLRAKHLLRHVM